MASGDDVQQVSRSVFWGQFLFTLGHSLTAGPFLSYFVNDFRVSAGFLALVLAAPEIAETCGLLARPLVRLVGSRKRLWMSALVSARVMALGIPLTGWLAHAGLAHPGRWLLGFLLLWYALQGIGYAAYVSWISDLAPEARWGHVFSRRNLGKILVLLIVPPVTSHLRRMWAETLPPDERWMTYAAIFVAGGIVVLASILPLLRLPDIPLRPRVRTDESPKPSAGDPRGLRWYLGHSWTLSLSQGLTQAVLFDYQVRVLKIPLEWSLTFAALMQGVQFVLTPGAGALSDRRGDRGPLIASVLGVSLAMPLFLLATPARWEFVAAAYAVWGLFGIVNVCTLNLMLRLSPRSDNLSPIALQQQVGGMLSGLAGLAGALWLDRMKLAAPGGLGPYQGVILISWFGRMASVLPLLMIRDPARPVIAEDVERRPWSPSQVTIPP